MKKRCKGSITIEAAIVLPITILLIFSLSSITRLFLVYNRVQLALNQTVKTFSTYSYPLYYKTGLMEVHDKRIEEYNEVTNKAKQDFNKLSELVDDFNAISDSAGNLYSQNRGSIPSLVEIQDIVKKIEKAGHNSQEVKDIISEYIKNPKQLVNIMSSCVINMGYEFLEKEVSNILSEAVFYNYLSIDKMSREECNEQYSISNLSIDSSIYTDMEHIKLTAEYCFEPISFLGFSPKLKINQSAVIRGLTNGNENRVNVKQTMYENLWEQKGDKLIDKNVNRGLCLEERYILDETNYTVVNGFSPIDAYYKDTKTPVCIFSLDTTYETYAKKPSQIKAQIKRQVNGIKNYKTKTKTINEMDITFDKNEFKQVIIVLILPEGALNNKKIKQVIDGARKNIVENQTINNKKIFKLEVFEGYGKGRYAKK